MNFSTDLRRERRRIPACPVKIPLLGASGRPCSACKVQNSMPTTFLLQIAFSQAKTAPNTIRSFPDFSIIPVMSFLFGGRPQLSSAEKIAAAELEVEMVSDMLHRCLSFPPSAPSFLHTFSIRFVKIQLTKLKSAASFNPVLRSAFHPNIASRS